jgi:hypothetical protein
MRNFLLFILLIITVQTFGQWPQKKTEFVLTDQDRKAFVLSVDRRKISKPRDTAVLWGKKKYRVEDTKVKLSNLSNDTLAYINMTCSTFDTFISTNSDVLVGQWPCEYNSATVYKIPPHKSSVFDLPLLFTKQSVVNSKIKIGIFLCRYTKKEDMETFKYYQMHSSKWPQSCLIWSNEITISK